MGQGTNAADPRAALRSDGDDKGGERAQRIGVQHNPPAFLTERTPVPELALPLRPSAHGAERDIPRTAFP